jgi:hypothetical protein
MHRNRPTQPVLCLLGILAVLLSSLWPSLALAETSATITVSGTVSGPGGPVAQAQVNVWTQESWMQTTTTASGTYNVSIQAGGFVAIAVRPPLASMLAQANLWTAWVSGNMTQNFSLVSGHLLSLQLTDELGQALDPGGPLNAIPTIANLPSGYYYTLDHAGDESPGKFTGVLPPDIYSLEINDPPDGYYPTRAVYDLRTSNQSAELAYNIELVHPIPSEPPVAGKISFGAPDDLGEATVSGSAGAALPLAHVFLVNLNSAHQAYTVSEADGSFSCRIYAPPGSAIMVKHGPASERWNDLAVGVSEGLNPYPGTILHVPFDASAEPGVQAFAASGAISHFIDDPNTTVNYVGSAWALSGSLQRVRVDGEWSRQLDGIYGGNDLPGLYLGGMNWTHPTLGDLDKDGKLDLLVGERSGHLVYYHNLGDPSTPEWVFTAQEYAGIEVDFWAYPLLADLNGDDALDLLVGTENEGLRIYYNIGTPSSAAWSGEPDISLSAGQNAAPALDDLDGDGDLDLLIGHAGGTLYHYKNTGTSLAPSWTWLTNSYAAISESSECLQPAFVDLDSDGDQDLLFGLCGEFIWYQRGGTSSSPTWTRIAVDPIGYGGGSSATSPGVGDWDGDDKLDLVIGEHWGVLRYFHNEGASSWSESSFPYPFDLLGDSAPALADWDQDGDLDLLLGQAHGEVHKFTNDGSSSVPDWQYDGLLLTLPWTDHPHAFPALVDIDGDGDQDLFIGEGGWQSEDAGGQIHFYRNQGTPFLPNWVLDTDTFLGIDVGGWSTPAFADIDADGDFDLFIGDEAGSLTFVENTGSASSPAWAVPQQPYASLQLDRYSAPAFMDVDDDVDLDILSGQGNGSLAYIRNTGNKNQPAWELVSTTYPGIDIGENSIPAVGDLNGDGKADLSLGDVDGGLNLFIYQGAGTPPALDSPYQPGDMFQVQGKMRLYSPAINSTTNLEALVANGDLILQKQHDAQGLPLATDNYYMSTLLTPTGFPIQSMARPIIRLNQQANLTNLHLVGEHAIEGDLLINGQIPLDLQPGIYRPVLGFWFTGVPEDTSRWLAANVTYHSFHTNEAALPPLTVGEVDQPRLIWRLLMEDFVQGTRGAGAHQDAGTFELASQIVSQGAPLVIPPLDEQSGQALVYRLEPFLPMISYTDRRMPTPPLLPLDLPGGELQVMVHYPDGSTRDLGTQVFAQSFNSSRTTRSGSDLNNGTVQLEDVYSLKAASDSFHLTFSQYGHHLISMTGFVQDLWGNTYTAGGDYDVWVAHPLDVDPGVLPGTPLAVGDAYNPAMQFYPAVPADVELTITHYPHSDPAQKITHTIKGRANSNGYFSPGNPPPVLSQPGEYRVDLAASYRDPSGKLYLARSTWGSIVMTPANQAELVAHGRRGLDSLLSIPNQWFVSSRDLSIPAGAVSHSLNPYYNGDILWSRMSDGAYGGDSLILGSSLQDLLGEIKEQIYERAQRMHPGLSAPGSLEERFYQEEIPLFISTYSGFAPTFVPEDIDQLAYSYLSSQRPGVRVREVVAEDSQSGGYWRLDTLYDDQLSVGIQGDMVNDFKFQYVGAVYRDLDNGHNEYLGQGSGWIFIPDDDVLGSRVMPPFAGDGNGGWTAEGGPILTLKGQAIDIFILPTGVQAGTILETGQRFQFAGHIMPTLNSQVSWTASAPDGTQHSGSGIANQIGYYYDPADDFTLDQPGLWSVEVSVWHDGTCSGGATVEPYPTGDVLGSESGRYWFYVVPPSTDALSIQTPSAGWLTFENGVNPLSVEGRVPLGWSDVSLDYSIRMPGYILQHGQESLTGFAFKLLFDPLSLAQDYPNLDLYGRDSYKPGLSDTITISILLSGQLDGHSVQRAASVILQGSQVFVPQSTSDTYLFLPFALRK